MKKFLMYTFDHYEIQMGGPTDPVGPREQKHVSIVPIVVDERERWVIETVMRYVEYGARDYRFVEVKDYDSEQDE